jgi:hypothetical protein
MSQARTAPGARPLRCGRLLEAATLGWNVVGIVVLAIAALRAHSVALAGFGLDSLIEIGAGTVVLWALSVLISATRDGRLFTVRPGRFPVQSYPAENWRRQLLRLRSGLRAGGSPHCLLHPGRRRCRCLLRESRRLRCPTTDHEPTPRAIYRLG